MMTNTDKVFDILDEKNEIQDDENAEELYECKGEITFENGKYTCPNTDSTLTSHPASNTNISWRQGKKEERGASEGARQCVIHSSAWPACGTCR